MGRTQDSKFEPWRSVAEHATSRSLRLPTVFNLHGGAGRKHFVSLKLKGQSGVFNPRSSIFQAGTTAPAALTPLLSREIRPKIMTRHVKAAASL